MIQTLAQIVEDDSAPSLIEPIPLQESDVPGTEFTPICLLGIFNPMGPTLVGLTHLRKEGSASGAILYTSLNPFAQTRLLTARAPSAPDHLPSILESLHRVGEEFLLAAAPTVVAPSLEGESLDQALGNMLFNLICSVPSSEPLAESNKDFREHWRDPWSRIPAMSDVMEQTLKGGGEPLACNEPSQADFDEWYSIVTNLEHLPAELGAIVQGWTGAIRFAAGLPHMPLNEAAAELEFLGFPYLNAVA